MTEIQNEMILKISPIEKLVMNFLDREEREHALYSALSLSTNGKSPYPYPTTEREIERIPWINDGCGFFPSCCCDKIKKVNNTIEANFSEWYKAFYGLDSVLAFCDNVGYYGNLVYVVGSALDNKIKIGKTKDIKQRLRSLATGSPNSLFVFGLILDYKDNLENELHDYLREYRINGEWFNLDYDHLDGLFIQINRENNKVYELYYKGASSSICCSIDYETFRNRTYINA